MCKKLIAFIMLAVLVACMGAAAEGKPSVVCTSFPCFDFARSVAGENAEVSLLIKPGVEVHAYDPTPSDILSIGGADLFVYVGGESDAWVEGILSGFDAAEAPESLRMMDCVSALIEEAGDDHHRDHD